MNTDDKPFLPADRTFKDEIVATFKTLSEVENMRSIIDAMPCLVAVLDKNRQIVYCNESLLSVLDVEDIENLIGLRPGAAFGCVHLNKCDMGCGTTSHCKYCGAAQAIKTCLETKKKTTKECRLMSAEGSIGALDLSVTATPFEVKSRTFTMLSINDISDKKRRHGLEKIFFHDIVNSAGCISSSLTLLDDCDSEEEYQQFIGLAKTASLSMIEEVKFQRTLLAAESNELAIVIEQFKVKDLYDEIHDLWVPFALFSGIKLIFEHEAKTIATDKNVIKRIIGNLIKNAVEASVRGDVVTVTCSEASLITVNNPAVVTQGILDQMFQRSFSTKGNGRGIGTYSVKLFTESYLHGSVSVSSNEGSGTTVFVQL